MGDGALVKRGSKDTQCGRRVDCLSSHELDAQFKTLTNKCCEKKAKHWLMKSRITRLKINHHGLNLDVIENFNRKGVFSSCKNILAIHKTNAFRGKQILWDFLKDVTTNLNCIT